jgi:hypothetical protein
VNGVLCRLAERGYKRKRLINSVSSENVVFDSLLADNVAEAWRQSGNREGEERLQLEAVARRLVKTQQIKTKRVL